MSIMLQHALAWASRGFRVFPCVPRTKIPRDDAFFSVATCEPAEVEKLWHNPVTGEPGDYNVGVSTDNLVVIDVDVKDGRNGPAGFIELGGDANTLAVTTPTGGIHYYYEGPSSRNRVNIATGVDVRSHHGYVLAPGSYVFDRDKGIDGYYRVLNEAPMAYVPEALGQRLTPPRETRARIAADVELDDDIAIEQASDFLQFTARPSIEGLGGNNNAYEVAAHVVNDYAISTDIAAILMAQYWNGRCVPPWELSDLYRFCENASRYATGVAGVRRAEVMFGEVTVLPTVLQQTPQQRGLYLGNLPDALGLPSRPWVYNKLALRREVTTVVAEGAGGKSTTALLIAAHAALGRDFGPFELAVPGRPLRVLVHDDENTRDEQARIMLAICAEYQLDYAAVKKNIVIWAKEDPTLTLAHAEGQRVVRNDDNLRMLTDIVRDGSIDIFMLNPLVNLHQCNENDNAQMKSVMGLIAHVAHETNAAAFVFHHSSKGSAGPGKKAAGNSEISRGAGAIINSSRIALTFTSPSEDDKEAIGIRDADTQYTRVDDAKTNVFARGNPSHAKLWFRWKGTQIGTGDVMGVPMLFDIQRVADSLDEVVMAALDKITAEEGIGSIPVKTAIDKLRQSDSLLSRRQPATMQAHLDKIITEGRSFTLSEGRTVRLSKFIGSDGTTYLTLH